MNLHEYQTKELLKKYGVEAPLFMVAGTIDEALKGWKEFGVTEGVAKIQVHAGGRGKAGGIKKFSGLEGLREEAKKLIGFKMVNNQTGSQGVIAEKIMVSPLVDIEKEYYLAITIDRNSKRPILIASQEGGMEIEEIAAKDPKKVLKMPLYAETGLKTFQKIELKKFMGWDKNLAEEGFKVVSGLLNAFLALDASLLEINPLILTKGKLLALDAKMSIDDNALFRHVDLQKLEDLTQLPEEERLARVAELAYIALDGDIGCMVNGAGLAMATMDMILLYGGKPANFLDVGGSATEEKISEGFRILLADKRVQGILINIFGGIMNCETIADGVIAAVKKTDLKVPLVVRMEGTNVDVGRAKLKNSGLQLTSTHSLKEAAEVIVRSVNGNIRK